MLAISMKPLWLIIGRRAGESVLLRLHRAAKILKTRVTLAEIPQPEGGDLLQAHFGLEGEPMRDRTAKRLGFQRPLGLTITAVERGGPADLAGLRTGHVILHLGRFQVRRLDEVGSLLSAVQSGQRVRLDVLQASRGRLVRRIVMLTAR